MTVYENACFWIEHLRFFLARTSESSSLSMVKTHDAVVGAESHPSCSRDPNRLNKYTETHRENVTNHFKEFDSFMTMLKFMLKLNQKYCTKYSQIFIRHILHTIIHDTHSIALHALSGSRELVLPLLRTTCGRHTTSFPPGNLRTKDP